MIEKSLMLPSEKELELQLQQTALTNGGFRKKRSSTRRTTPQIIATIAFGMLIFGVSAICVMPTIVIGALYKEGNATEIHITAQQASWFGSIVYIAQPLGSVTSGFIQEIFGRRRCMMVVNIPQVIGWVILCFSQKVEQLYIGAVIMGLSVGFMEAPAMSYLGEICEPRLRGTLSSFSETFLLVGILFEFFIGAVLYWRYACAASALIPVSAFILIYIIPESPTWYIVKERIPEAEKSLMWLRGWVTKEEVYQELTDLVHDIKSNHKELYTSVPTSECSVEKNNKGKAGSEWAQVKLLKEGRIYRPIILVALFFFIGHCTSLLGMRPFLVKVFADLNMALSPYTVLVITGFLQALGSVVCVIAIHRLGKRKLAFASLFICLIGLICLAIYILLSLNYPWIPLVLFGLIFFGGGVGVMTLPWVLVCEIFPLDARGISAGLAAASSYIFGFFVTKSYVDLVGLLGLPGVLILYFCIGIVGFIYLYYKLPETEGKSLAEIEEFFKNKPAALSQTLPT